MLNNVILRGFVLFGVLLAVVCAAGASQLYRLDPGEASARVDAHELSLSNAAISARWTIADGRLEGLDVVDRWSGQSIRLPQCPFSLILRGGGAVQASEMKLVGLPAVEALSADKNASRLSERFGGRQIVLKLQDSERGLTVVWRGILRDGSNYIRQEISVTANNADLPIAEVRLIDGLMPEARVVGVVKGSPVVVGNFFVGFEHPLAEASISGDRVIYRMRRELPLKVGQTIEYSSVFGVAPASQLRRAFLNYVERERAHPYRTFLNYNSWYDIGYGDKYDEPAAVNVINAFGKELVQKRGVAIDSFLFDDGWDDPATLWHFGSGFPEGFTPLKTATAKYGSAPGVWLSPWGGYHDGKLQRLKYGREQGFESNDSGFALSGPKYYSRFRDITLEFVKKYDINQFKIDGTGNVNSAYPGSEFDSDFHAAISLIRDWRRIKPDIYVNLTTGTYPSPFWLRYADSIWRGGEDHSFAGVGSWRQRWITYRDAETYERVVQAGPLFPLNSLMLHGLIYAKQAEHLDTDPKADFSDEVHSFFGSGTQLQEMYITPTLLSQENWDTLAEAAKWARANADVLVDTHWIGGDPVELEVYGWASWAPEKGIVVLRNPSDKAQNFLLDVGQAFELPVGAAKVYEAVSPWKDDHKKDSIKLQAGKPQTFHLMPFQVITLQMVPK